MVKRLFDILVSAMGLVASAPILIPVSVLVWLQDFHSPFYIAPRVGRNGQLFMMVKLRSMRIGADRTGVDSTSANDNRITPIGKFIRTYKLDELTQLWNVLVGEMSLVGPRPNVKRETDLYTDIEKKLLDVRPGITDISSIVFSDEGVVLQDKQDPDLAYNQLIRPWKSRLGILYVENISLILDIKIIFLTVVAVISRERALAGINKILCRLSKNDEMLIKVAKRRDQLLPYPPPGAKEIVSSR